VKPLPPQVRAVHEAGHAVVSVVLRTGVTRVDIADGPNGREGLTSYRPVPYRYAGSRDVLARRGTVALGGMAAEWLSSCKVGKPHLSMGDWPIIMTYIYEITGVSPPDDAVQALWDEWLDRAVGILEPRWAAVQAVAAALVQDVAINRRRLLELVPR
jgi:hypothetical protein